MVPPGWQVSSENAVQTVQVKERQESETGLVAEWMPAHVGLIQVLDISGRVAARVKYEELVPVSDASIVAISPSEEETRVAVDADGRYSIEGEPGRWVLRVETPGRGPTIEREVAVEQAPVRLSTMLTGEAPFERAPRTKTVDFESVTDLPITKMPRESDELEWTHMVVVDNQLYRGAGYVNNSTSGRHVAYSTSGYPVIVTRDGGFDFRGAYFGVAWPEGEGEILRVRAWRGEQLIGEDELKLSALGPVWFDADYRRITRLELATRYNWQFVVDDFRIGLPD